MATGQPQPARDLFLAWTNALEHDKSAGRWGNQRIADAMIALKDDAGAVYHLLRAAKAGADPINSHGSFYGVSQRLSECYARLGNTAEAQRYADMTRMYAVGKQIGEFKTLKLLSKGERVFPKELQRWGVEGEVYIDVLADSDGKVKYPVVVQSTHPGFEIAAMKAVTSMKHEAATKNDVPVPVLWRVPFLFSFDPRSSERTALYKLESESTAATTDSKPTVKPARMKLITLAAYPRRLLIDGKRGSANIKALVGMDGEVEKVEVVDATRPEFGDAAKAMLYNWSFTPAIANGRNVKTWINYKHTFDLELFDNNLNEETQKVVQALRKNSSDIVEMAALDARPKLIYQPQFKDPRPPRAADAKPDVVRLEFIIDVEGRLQAPRIVNATNMDLAWSIATITSRWLYEVPKVNGKPVMVRHELEFLVN